MAKAATTVTRVTSKIITGINTLSVANVMDDPGSTKAVCTSHGRPRPTKISNTFEPIAFETAIEPLPCFAATILHMTQLKPRITE